MKKGIQRHQGRPKNSALVAELRRQGTPIPTNDIWIAAVTLENGGRVVASDDHFTWVP